MQAFRQIHSSRARANRCRAPAGRVFVKRDPVGLTNVTEETTQLSLPSRVGSIDEAAQAAAEAARHAGLGDEALFGLDMAVREAVTNAVLHGNRQDEAKPVEISFSQGAGEFVVTVRDRGEGFDPETVADPTAAENLLKASGRGILFMRTFMDSVEWTRHPEGGTVVRMAKKI